MDSKFLTRLFKKKEVIRDLAQKAAATGKELESGEFSTTLSGTPTEYGRSPRDTKQASDGVRYEGA